MTCLHCNNPIRTRGVCAHHYLVAFREMKRRSIGWETLIAEGKATKTKAERFPSCRVTGCGGKVVGSGMCSAHYQRVKNNGSVQEGIAVGDKSGSRNPRWKGGEIQDGHGRTLIYSPNHPNPNWCGTHVYRYRLVMEQQLGRFLRPDEVVHHKNGDHSDDRPENLVVMSQSEHAKTHQQEMQNRRKKNGLIHSVRR